MSKVPTTLAQEIFVVHLIWYNPEGKKLGSLVVCYEEEKGDAMIRKNREMVVCKE